MDWLIPCVLITIPIADQDNVAHSGFCIISAYFSSDYLTIFDGYPTNKSDHHQLGWFVGTPDSGAHAAWYSNSSVLGVRSTRNDVLIYFASDEYDSRSGFILQYSVGTFHICDKYTLELSIVNIAAYCNIMLKCNPLYLFYNCRSSFQWCCLWS